MADPIESLPVLGDLLKHEHDSRYCRVAAWPAAADPADGDIPASLLGYPVSLATVDGKNRFTLLIAGGEANCEGLILDQRRHGPALADLAPMGLAVLTRGPAIVNRNAIPTVDYAGASLNLDTITAALSARGIEVFDEHPETAIQPL